jgi:hypothetical protein
MLAPMASVVFLLAQSVMSQSTSRILAYLALALASFIGAAEAYASVGDMSGSALASFGRLSPVQSVQYGGGNCYYPEGWNGHGWYQCGDQWNEGFGWIGPFNLNTFGGSANRRHRRVGVAVPHPTAPNPVYPRVEPSRRLGVGGAAPSVGLRAGGAPAFQTFHSPGFRRFGAGGVHASPNFRAGAAAVTPGLVGDGLHGGLGGGNFHQFHGAGLPHIRAPVTPGLAGGGGFHGLGGAGKFHGAGIGIPHIGAPASPGFAGVGTFHAGGAVGAPHIGAPASPGFTGGGFHGVGGTGAFQSGGAGFGVGGIGHR